MIKGDKEIERRRYDDRAKKTLLNKNKVEFDSLESLPTSLKAPYLYYEEVVGKYVTNSEMYILEIGAGTGAFTGIALKTGAYVTATDISENSIKVIFENLGEFGRLDVKVADMESIPFQDDSFDIVLSAGSLSYGDNNIVMSEIYRILRSKGVFICVDSLNNNPIYRLNRWMHYLRGNRTKSTLVRMPNLSLIKRYEKKFGKIDVKYFGAITWLTPFLQLFLSDKSLEKVINQFDKKVNVKSSAFKFVMVAKKK